ncbi:MAG TPA: hypothetical protein VE988_06930 [Gemmataceae bacterium]|nr:hypothetical protein [Gemmataceae bacterium]
MSDQEKTEQPPAESDSAMARVETLVCQTRQAILEGVEQIMLRQAEPILERTRVMLLASTDTVLREQAEPLLVRIRELLLETLEEMAHRQVEPLIERGRQMMLNVVEEIMQRHAAPLVGQVRSALQQSLEEVVQKQMEPMLEKARASFQETAQLAAQFTDGIVSRLKVTVGTPATEMLQERMPGYAYRAQRRVLFYVVASTLFVLAAVLLLVAGVFGMQAAGVSPYITYAVGGLVALTGGWVLLWLSGRPLQRRPDGFKQT